MQLDKKWLHINGVDRLVVFDPEKDSLADALRRLGLTGTKVGCNAGMCGACSVVLDGNVVRSCRQKLNLVKEYAKVITIEGIGTPMHLHPLQEAWITYGSVQCGFCSPGFIVSAYGLLLNNPDPTRQEVRDWFQKHRNACRCTGYKPLVDAVIAAAKVMRGEASIQSIRYQPPEDGAYYGTAVPRPSAIAKVCGLSDYGADVAQQMPEGTLHLALVQPRVAHHAKILNIDFSEAAQMPGVVKVVTAKDVQGNNLINQYLTHPRSKISVPNRPILCDKQIFRYGDAVAVVAADTEEHARAAAAKVRVEIEKLPEYLSYLDAVTPDAMQIHQESPNIYVTQPVIKGRATDEVVQESKYAVSCSVRSSREPHMSLEGDIVQAYWGADGMMTIHCKSQGFKLSRTVIAKGIGLEEEKIRMLHNPGVGGSFGWSTNSVSYAIAAVTVMATGKPVTLTMDYEEFMHFSGKRAAAHINGRLACDANGKLTALEYDAGVDHGAYSEMADGLLKKFINLGGSYAIPNVRGLARSAYTNHNVGVAYRGFGYPQAGTVMETLMDMLAEKAGIDPFEFRYINLIREGDLTVNSVPMREYLYQPLMDAARPYYEEMKQKMAAESTDKKKRGVGVALSLYRPCSGPFDKASVALELMPDNTVTHYNTWEDVGQGSDIGSLMVTLEALKPLGLKPDQVHLHVNDTKECPDSGMAAGSRSHFMNGNATIEAANQLLGAMRKPDGTYRTYDEMRAEGIPTKYVGTHDLTNLCLGTIDPNTGVGDTSPTGMYSVCISTVEVDVDTGKSTVLSMRMWADVGILGNKLAAEGQAYGGMSHCIGFALSEDYDDVVKHRNLIGAGLPYINDIPDDIEVNWIQTPREFGPFGSSGIAELFQNSEHMAVINAIYNATGVRIFELPAYPEKVKAGLDKLANGECVLPPEMYYLGPDFYDELAQVEAELT